MTLKQAYPPEYQRVQGAFKDSMIHWILQFTLLIAFRCVLHRCESQEIRCWKLYLICLLAMMTFLTEAFVLRHRRGFQNRLAKVSLSHQAYNKCTGVIVSGWAGCAHACEGQLQPISKLVNDPSAGSPTETLLRLLLPLNDQVWSSSQRQGAVAGSPKPIPRPH